MWVKVALQWIPFVLIQLDKFFDLLTKFKQMRQKSIIGTRDNSVQNPTAHNTTLCAVRNKLNPVIKKAIALSEPTSSWPMPLKVLILLQLTFGLRISEVLNIKHSDILELGRLRIRTLKKGIDRIVYFDDRYGYFKRCKASGVNPFQDYNRFFIYRLYKKEGIMMFHDSSKKWSVTHSLRHFMVQQVMNEVNEKNLVTRYIGHSSKESLDNYL
jgi:integrase